MLQSLPWRLSQVDGLAYFTFLHHTMTELKTVQWGGLFPLMAGEAVLGGHAL